MEKYRLVQEHKADEAMETVNTTGSSGHADNFPQVRITQQGKPRNYISYAMSLFADGSSAIVLKAMGRAINKAVTIAEILKRKMPLHQQNALQSVEMVDVYEPVEEGLDTVTSRRYVSCMMITLSRTLIDPHHAGYQPPLPAHELQHPGDYHAGGAHHAGYQPPLPAHELQHPGDYHAGGGSSSSSSVTGGPQTLLTSTG